MTFIAKNGIIFQKGSEPMRFKIYFELENEEINLDYRRSIVSFIKKSLQEYDTEYFNQLYHAKDTIIKNYTFAVFFDRANFSKDKIQVENKKLNITFSTNDCENAIILYNAFLHQKQKNFSLNRNSMTLKSIEMIPERKIIAEELTIKFLSPLVVKARENQKDTYYSFERKEFYDVIKINIRSVLKAMKIDEKIVEDFQMIPIEAKKVIVKNYDIDLECSIGKFKLYGKKELLELLYQIGMGSKRSMGFGMFQIIKS